MKESIVIPCLFIRFNVWFGYHNRLLMNWASLFITNKYLSSIKQNLNKIINQKVKRKYAMLNIDVSFGFLKNCVANFMLEVKKMGVRIIASFNISISIDTNSTI